MRRKLTDPALAFILRKLRELPEEQRKGLDADCREHGILTPRMLDDVAEYETSFSSLTMKEAREVLCKTGINARDINEDAQ